MNHKGNDIFFVACSKMCSLCLIPFFTKGKDTSTFMIDKDNNSFILLAISSYKLGHYACTDIK